MLTDTIFPFGKIQLLKLHKICDHIRKPRGRAPRKLPYASRFLRRRSLHNRPSLSQRGGTSQGKEFPNRGKRGLGKSKELRGTVCFSFLLMTAATHLSI
ncbi:hypothetical protein BDV32DRAFT_115540 [Aspergillus pseudonomiae]|nr:hypothetical protein BDV32DRAFT_115540 [Aspergillus pseudonomiae]